MTEPNKSGDLTPNQDSVEQAKRSSVPERIWRCRECSRVYDGKDEYVEHYTGCSLENCGTNMMDEYTLTSIADKREKELRNIIELKSERLKEVEAELEMAKDSINNR